MLFQCSCSRGTRSNAHPCQTLLTKMTEIISLVPLSDAFSGLLVFNELFRDFSQLAAGKWLCSWCFVPFVAIFVYNLEPSALCQSYIAKLMLQVAHLFD